MYHLKTVCKTGRLVDRENKMSLSSSASSSKMCEENGKSGISKCEFCGVLVYGRNLKRHVKRNHGKEGIFSTRRKFDCKYCNLSDGSEMM